MFKRSEKLNNINKEIKFLETELNRKKLKIISIKKELETFEKIQGKLLKELDAESMKTYVDELKSTLPTDEDLNNKLKDLEDLKNETRLDIQALKLSRESDYESDDFLSDFRIDFDEIEMPKDAKRMSDWAMLKNPPEKFIEAFKYMVDRNLTQARLFDNIYWSPEIKNQMSNRIIIPFTFGGKFIGYTARFIKKNIPGSITKYHTQCPNGFLFNNEHIDNQDRKYIILVEGPIDALRIDGVAYMSNTVIPKQVSWLNTSNKDIILVPDKDTSGLEAVEIAIENNWHVSFPDWEGVGDVDEAVNKYGTIWTVRNILNNKTNNKTQIKVQEKLWLR